MKHSEVTATNEKQMPSRKKSRTEDNISDLHDSVRKGEQLTDLQMLHTQKLPMQPFPHLNSLQPTVRGNAEKENNPPMPYQLQIIHTHRNHWILVSNMNCEISVVNVYDSLYESIDENTRKIIINNIMFQALSVNLVTSQKQEGVVDSGLFAATSLAHRSLYTVANATALGELSRISL